MATVLPPEACITSDGNAHAYSSMADDSAQSPQKREAAMLLSIAESEADRGVEGKEKVLASATTALDLFRSLGEVDAAADALRLVCQAKSWGGDANVQEALVMAKEELSKFREIGSLAGQGKMLLTIAEISMYSDKLDQYDQKTLEEAPRSANSARALFHDLEDSKMEGLALQALGNAHLRRCDKWRWKDDDKEREARAAEDCFTEAQRLFVKADDNANQIKANFNIAAARFSAIWPRGGESFGDWRTAAQLAVDMCEQSGNKREQAYILYSMCGWHELVKEHEEVLSTAKIALDLVKEVGIKNGIPESLLQYMASAYMEMEQSHDANALCEQELALAAEAGNWAMVASCHQMLMHSYNILERHDEAYEECEKALQCVREKLQDRRWELNLLARMAQAKLNLNEQDQALKLAMQAADGYKKQGDRWQEALVLHTAVESYIAQENWDAAARACKRAKDIWRQRDCKTNECVTLNLLFEIEMGRLNGKAAVQFILQVASLQRKMGNRRSEAAALLESVKAYWLLGKRPKALDAAKKALAIFKEENDIDGQNWALDTVSKIEGQSSGQSADPVPASPQMQTNVEQGGASAADPGSASVAESKPSLDFDMVHQKVIELAKLVVYLDEDQLHDDTPLMDAGIDSLSSVSFRNQLMTAFKGIRLPASLMFDHPNMREISEAIVQQSQSM